MLDSSYWEMGPRDGQERTAYFVLDALLRSRIDCGFESNQRQYDEEVNIYLVHLLSRLVLGHSLLAGPERDIDVFHAVKDSGDPRHKCAVYRATADQLLLSTSLFTDTPYVAREGRREFDGTARERIGRGKAYYHYAASYLERLPAVSPAFAQVLAHLSRDFERYVDVLFHMRGEYFHLYERLRDDVLGALPPAGPDLPEPEPGSVADLRDQFLDAYWAWHQNPEEGNRRRLDEAVQRLQRADPDFGFDLPS
ncbi:MAG: hypothetical protein R3B81_07425 [bacterium]